MSLVSDAVHHAESRNRAVTDIIGAGNFPHQFVVNHAGILHQDFWTRKVTFFQRANFGA